jgi:hypothetical protein
MTGNTPRILHAHAYRDGGKWWTIEIPELTSETPDGKTIVAIGGAVSLKELDTAARDLAAVWLDVDENTLEVHVTIDVPEEVRQLWDDGAHAEAEARAAVQRAAALRRQAVRALRNNGYTLEATAAGLSISKQRAQQLAKEAGTHDATRAAS